MNNNKLATIDLFAGAGGLTEGFRQLGFRSLFANDHEQPALDTFNRNHPETLTSSAPIETLPASELRAELGLSKGELSVLMGGPPCQGFSTYGQRKTGDKRNRLYEYFLYYLEEFRPKTFLIENVVGILSMEGGQVIEDIQERCSALGYGVTVLKLNAANYGVPQHRNRVFIWGGLSGSVLEEPKPTFHIQKKNSNSQRQLSLFSTFEDDLPLALTVRDAISDLPELVQRGVNTPTDLPIDN